MYLVQTTPKKPMSNWVRTKLKLGLKVHSFETSIRSSPNPLKIGVWVPSPGSTQTVGN